MSTYLAKPKRSHHTELKGILEKTLQNYGECAAWRPKMVGQGDPGGADPKGILTIERQKSSKFQFFQFFQFFLKKFETFKKSSFFAKKTLFSKNRDFFDFSKNLEKIDIFSKFSTFFRTKISRSGPKIDENRAKFRTDPARSRDLEFCQLRATTHLVRKSISFHKLK